MNRKEILETATKTICNDRQDVYGNPEDSFPIIAKYWETYLTQITGNNIKLTPRNAAEMLCLFKLARITTGKFKEDNYIDLCGYAAIAGSLIDIVKDNKDEDLDERSFLKEYCTNFAEKKIVSYNKDGNYTIAEGLFQQDGVKNRNGRIYLKEDLEPELHAPRQKELFAAKNVKEFSNESRSKHLQFRKLIRQMFSVATVIGSKVFVETHVNDLSELIKISSEIPFDLFSDNDLKSWMNLYGFLGHYIYPVLSFNEMENFSSFMEKAERRLNEHNTF